jgi:ABC-2 type transport system permease protein
MHKVWAVIRREFLERVRTRQFAIGTVLGPILMAALIVLPVMLQRNTSIKHIVVLDAAEGGFGARVETALRNATRNDKPDGEARYRVSRVTSSAEGLEVSLDSLVARSDRAALGQESVDGIVVVTEDVLVTDTLRYLGSNVGSPSEMGGLQRTVRQAVILEKLSRAGIDPGLMMNSVKPVSMETERLSQGQVTGQSGEASFAIAYAMSFILYMALLLYGVQVMTSTVEEKSNRINEILISSLRPFELMLGKVVGVGSVGLVQLSIWAGTAWVLTSQRDAIGKLLGASPEAVTQMPIPAIPGSLLAVFLLYFVLGFFFYAAAYAAVGSTCSTVQETQQASLPVTMFVIIGLMLMFRLLDEPNGQFGRVLSLVPPFAPFVTPVRYSLSPLPWTELAASVGAMLVGVLAMAWVAGRIYRVGILMYGKRPKLSEMLRWVRAG